MSRSTIHSQFLLNDGSGNKLPIATGTFVTQSVNVEEQRRLSLTIGITSATGAVGDAGGFTGTLQVQGTNELAQCNGAPGTQEAGNTRRPGTNGFTGALFWQAIPSGTINITNATKTLLLDFNDIGASFIRVTMNTTGTGFINTGAAGGSGVMHIYYTAKNT